jgi:hypothetical protein
MAGPGSPSNTTNFGLSNGMLVLEAFERLGIDDPQIVRNKIRTATISLQLELQRFGSPARGINLWNVLENQVINLVEGQATYPIADNILAITDMWYSTINGNGAGYNLDRILTPITRQQYSQIPNKLQPGTPTQWWFQKLPDQQVTIWQPPSQAAPNYLIFYNALQRIDDANLGSGETPDVAYRALDAVCARLAYRLVKKVIPRQEWATVLPAMKADKEEADADFFTEDQEDGPMIIQPNVAPYGRL